VVVELAFDPPGGGPAGGGLRYSAMAGALASKPESRHAPADFRDSTLVETAFPRATLDNRAGTPIVAAARPWYPHPNTHELLPRPLA
jgi:hypothetical protein